MEILKICLILFFSCLTFLGFSQKNKSPKQGRIMGKIMTVENNQPIEYATISIFDVKNNNLITGESTDSTGAFLIDIPFGNYFAKIDFITFQSQTLEAFFLTKEKPIIDLGNIILENKNNTLTEVKVTGEKSRLQYGLDKKVFNLGTDVLSEGGTVTQVLENIPSITVDPTGNVSLRGSSSVKILIDGKPSAMTSAKLMQNMSAAQVEKIEIITNPSAKYDAEGLSGIINIVMKKSAPASFGGSVNASVSHPHDYNLGVSLHRRKGKLNLFTDMGLRHWQRPKENNYNNTFTFSDTTYSTQINEEKIRRSYSGNINLGMDYTLDDKNVITTSFLYDLAWQPHDATTFFQDFDSDKNLVSNEIRTNDEVEKESSLEYLLNYERTFQKKGKSLKAFIKYIDNSEFNDSDLSEFASDSEQQPLNNETLKQRTSVDETDQNWIGQIDFIYPFQKKGKLELGAKATFRNIKNEFLVEELFQNNWLIKNGLSNDFFYREKIYAAYMSVGNKIKKISYQLGLRGELTDLKTELKQTAEINNRKPFFNLFPSAHIGYQLTEKNNFQVSYSRRIQRPEFQDLNPFFSFTNDRSILTGNPDLNPMYTHSFDLEFVHQSDFIVLGSSIYFRNTSDVIDEIFNVNDEGITLTTIENLNIKKSLGGEIFAEKRWNNWLETDASFDYRKVDIDGTQLNPNLQNTFDTWTARVGTKFRFSQKTLLQLRYFYRGANATIQGNIKPLSRFDVAFRKQILNGKGRISFSIYDLFFGYQIKYENVSPQLISIGVSKPWRPTASLSFQYRWK